MNTRQRLLLIEALDALINDIFWAKDWEKKELTHIKNELCLEIIKKKKGDGRKKG